MPSTRCGARGGGRAWRDPVSPRRQVWDAFGRQLFQSSPFEFVITCVRWAPGGDRFAVGAFNSLRLCDKTGWAHSRDSVDVGSVFGIAWTPDGTQVWRRWVPRLRARSVTHVGAQLAGACGSGAVVFGQVVGRCVREWVGQFDLMWHVICYVFVCGPVHARRVRLWA